MGEYVTEQNYQEKPEEEIEESVKIEAANTDFTIVGGVLEKYSGESTIVAVPNNVREIATDAFRGLS